MGAASGTVAGANVMQDLKEKTAARQLQAMAKLQFQAALGLTPLMKLLMMAVSG